MSGSADARDLVRVRETLAVAADAAAAVEESALADSPLAGLLNRFDRETAAALRTELDEAIADDPPATVRDGRLFRGATTTNWTTSSRATRRRFRGSTVSPTARSRNTGLRTSRPAGTRPTATTSRSGHSETDAVPERYDEIKSLKNAKRYIDRRVGGTRARGLRFEESRRATRIRPLLWTPRAGREDTPVLQDVGRALAEFDCLPSSRSTRARTAGHGPSWWARARHRGGSPPGGRARRRVRPERPLAHRRPRVPRGDGAEHVREVHLHAPESR